MGNYLIISRPLEDAQAAALSTRLRRLAQRQGWSVTDLNARTWLAVTGPRPPTFRHEGPWVVIGDCFRQRSSSPLSLATEDGSGLIMSAWGRFIAARLDSSGALTALLRDPSGAMECLTWRSSDLVIAASDTPEWLTQVLQPSWSIDYERIALALSEPAALSGASLLIGLTALVPGSLQELPVVRPAKLLWTPSSFARDGARLRQSDPMILRERLQACIDDLASVASPVAAEISGGLDSSIVAACLARTSGENVRAWVNVYGPDREGDERSYASALASHIDISPTFLPRPEGRLTLTVLEALSHGPRPGQNGMDFLHDQDMADHCKTWGVEAVFTGKGGDAILVHGLTGAVFEDLWHLRGWRAAFGPEVIGIARWTGRSLWSLIRDNLYPSPSPPQDGLRLASDSRPTDLIAHPWLEAIDDLGPAKRAQIRGLIDGIGFHGPSRQGAIVDLFHPLLCQPVVEHCLSLPTVLLTQARRDRALARDAFADLVPKMITERRWKGDLTAYFGRMIANSLSLLRPFLIDGRLTALGLLDRERLDEALRPENLAWRGGYGEIMTVAVIEAWVRSWEARLPPPA
jgi:asparagine synthase (glutamine-hydrolysing)